MNLALIYMLSSVIIFSFILMYLVYVFVQMYLKQCNSNRRKAKDTYYHDLYLQ